MANAIGMVEFTSIARGIYAADQMVKISEVEIVTASTTCPGKYIAIVHGDVAAVEDSVHIGEKVAGEYWVDSIIIPNVHPQVFPAITGSTMPERVQAIGIMESFSMSTMVIAADAILKSAELEPLELRLGNGLGGKAFFTFTGDVAAVETGAEAGRNIAEEKGLLVNAEVIPSPSDRLIPSLF
ncbi:BMC domain-containing protein [Aminipila luticellarii]|uniref:BMC domain-containing protein n=1 Tax=Aminipila luticellarii TaxID=2507160 RepID=A0A410PTT3_9FIRM|nr:BMC domain-containing protein [Aminipila luticellarii]QAT42372.1 BMC domain-containing protein [Aminipila luticellarii]